MKNIHKKIMIVSLSGLIFGLSGCGSSSNDPVDITLIDTAKTVSSYTQDDGRLLAAGCAQCHGTNGISVNKWDSIVGEDNLHKEMFEKGGIMLSQAKGYTNSEITLMENYLNSISKTENDKGESDD